jgi:hypothetical protein
MAMLIVARIRGIAADQQEIVAQPQSRRHAGATSR